MNLSAVEAAIPQRRHGWGFVPTIRVCVACKDVATGDAPGSS